MWTCKGILWNRNRHWIDIFKNVVTTKSYLTGPDLFILIHLAKIYYRISAVVLAQSRNAYFKLARKRKKKKKDKLKQSSVLTVRWRFIPKMLVWLVIKCGSSFSLLVEMADQRPGARQASQSSLSKSCVALPQYFGGGEEGGWVGVGGVGGKREKTKTNLKMLRRYCHSLNEPGATVNTEIFHWHAATDVWKSFQGKMTGCSCAHVTANYKSRRDIILVQEPVLLSAVFLSRWATEPHPSRGKKKIEIPHTITPI